MPSMPGLRARTFAEVQHWPAMGAVEKRAVWRRITQHTAWRFNRYAERAAENRSSPGAAASSLSDFGRR